MTNLRSGASFPKREEPTAATPRRVISPALGRKPTGRSASASARVKKEEEKGPSDPPASGSRKRPASAAASSSAAAVEDTDALDCGLCFLPLKPPIFQCDVGHVVCSTCHDKLKATVKCHLCRGATGGFRRCHAMERLLESVRAPCPHAIHGCTARPTYYDLDAHSQMCPHSQCRCPGEACGFTGSIDALLDHFTSMHGWPQATKVRIEKNFQVINLCLHDVFNFLVASFVTNRVYLFLLNVTWESFGRAISVVHIHPRGAGHGPGGSLEEIIFELSFSSEQHGLIDHYYQSCKFRVVSTDLSNGLPNPVGCFQFVLLNSILGTGHLGNTAIEASAEITIRY